MSATSTSSAPEIIRQPDDVRPVRDDEVGFFHQNGWVLLRGLVAPGLCQEMLERGKPRLTSLMSGSDLDFATPEEKRKHMRVSSSPEGTVTDNKKWVEWRGAIRSAHDPVFGRAALAQVMGRNVQRLLERQKIMRVYHDIFMCKLADQVSTHTGWHQDSTNFPLDRQALTIWIALDEIRPEQGSLQFYSGSHRCGMLGKIGPDPAVDLLDEYPELARFAISPAPHLHAGDATVHHGLTVHGAGINRTADPRWSFAVCYVPSDARYTGAPNHDCDGLGLRIGYPIEHPSFTPVPE